MEFILEKLYQTQRARDCTEPEELRATELNSVGIIDVVPM